MPYAAHNIEKKRESCRRWARKNREKKRVQVKAWLKAHPKKGAEYSARRNAHLGSVGRRTRKLKHKYGLTRSDVVEMLASQGGCCAVCRVATPGAGEWPVDHCHRTGIVRGLLCRSCNSAIGWLRDDPKLLRAAANYIETALRAGRIRQLA